MSAPHVGEGAVCEKCGAPVGKNEEGRITCTGCNMATDNCTCSRPGA
jgi:uncharacterized Zn finger protein (UPF0148 family)